MSDLAGLRIFTGNAYPAFAREVADYLGVALGDATVSTFSDGEIRVKINDNVRSHDVFVIQSLAHPINTHLMELLIIMDALRRASASNMTAVIPYYGYARQDRKDQPRVPITAKLIADLIVTAGAKRVVTIDLHAGQIQGFFNIPVDHLYAAPVLLNYFRGRISNRTIVVAPDAGGVERARAFAKRLNLELAIIDKRREGPNQTKVVNVIGEVAGHDALLIDDIVDTAGTITQAADAVSARGATRVLLACTHPIFSGSAISRLNASPIDEIVVTNTIPPRGTTDVCKNLTTLSVAPLIGEAIKRIHTGVSVTSLFL